jgi:hypothetical protein
MLPVKFSPTGFYRSAEKVHLRAISFRILIHAEVESYIEDRAMALFSKGWSQWEKSKLPSNVIIGLLAYGGFATILPPKKLGGDPSNQKAYDDLKEPLQKAQKIWRQTHRNNHGIKEENILKLLLPLGVYHDDLDPTLLADLSSFGNDRGEVAHLSTVGITTYSDPSTEYNRAQALVTDLKKIDDLINKALGQIRKR